MTDRRETREADGLLLERWRDEPEVQATLAEDGFFMVHAAAFRLGTTEVLAFGPSGAGKSTLVAAALTAGGTVVSDDLLLLRLEPDGVVAYSNRPFLSFRDSGREILETAESTAALPLVWEVVSGRAILTLERCRGFAAHSVRPGALWVVDVAPRATSSAIETLPKASAFAALMGCISGRIALSGAAPVRARFVETMSQLMTQSQSCRVSFGRDLIEHPRVTAERLVSGASVG